MRGPRSTRGATSKHRVTVNRGWDVCWDIRDSLLTDLNGGAFGQGDRRLLGDAAIDVDADVAADDQGAQARESVRAPLVVGAAERGDGVAPRHVVGASEGFAEADVVLSRDRGEPVHADQLRVRQAMAFREILLGGDEAEFPAADLANLASEPELESVIRIPPRFVFLLLDLDDLDCGIREEALHVREVDEHA